ncbi:MAG: hypothetical protein ABIJ57_14735, partial [Pseudomonadota bacterium]
MPILSLFKTKKKKSRRTYLIGEIDKIVSLKVRKRDNYTCRKCGQNRSAYGLFGKKGHVFHHHIFTKSRLSTRWLLENGVTLCYFCHRWAHAAGEEFREWVLSWMPKAQYEVLYI